MKKNLLKNILVFTLVLFLSWIVLHFFAIFGVFLLVLYPIWILINPQREYCLFCTFVKDGTCFMCKYLEKDSKAPFKVIFFNYFIILFMIFISIGMIFVERYLLDRYNIISIQDATTLEIELEESYKVEEIFFMPIKFSNIYTPINTVRADVKFDPEYLDVIEVVTSESFANIFIEKEINNNLGFARITGGLPNPGYTGEEILFAKILFQTKKPGAVEVEVLPTSVILANDGKGTNILREFPRSTILISTEELNKSEKEYQEIFVNDTVLGVSDSKLYLTKEIDTEEVLGIMDYEENHSFIDLLYAFDSWFLGIIRNIYSVFYNMF